MLSPVARSRPSGMSSGVKNTSPSKVATLRPRATSTDSLEGSLDTTCVLALLAVLLSKPLSATAAKAEGWGCLKGLLPPPPPSAVPPTSACPSATGERTAAAPSAGGTAATAGLVTPSAVSAGTVGYGALSTAATCSDTQSSWRGGRPLKSTSRPSGCFKTSSLKATHLLAISGMPEYTSRRELQMMRSAMAPRPRTPMVTSPSRVCRHSHSDTSSMVSVQLIVVLLGKTGGMLCTSSTKGGSCSLAGS
mmetsp:Transcript_21307/g.64115  ORF Transcript_21307/g.64115 Transcript_21307/m.64115 type:complete len:249 (-) Transcript_21307:542-1288(-)